MNAEQENKDFLRITDLADLLGVDPKTIYRLIKKGEIPATRIGKLYFIKRTDIDAMFEKPQPTQKETAPPETPERERLTCGFCLRVLEGESDIADICCHTDCDEVICTNCLAAGIEHCDPHTPAPGQKLQAARDALEREGGELLVSARDARRMEKNFLARLGTRISQVNTLIHPQTREMLPVPDWGRPVMQDERAEVMSLLDAFFLDSETTRRIPLNAGVRFEVPPAPGQTGLPLVIQGQALNRLDAMVRDGFDSRAMNGDELTDLLIDLSDQAQDEGVAMLAVLAAPTGWDASARKIILGGAPGTAFADTNVRYYLLDMQTNELIYNPQDRLSRGYAELFKPQLAGEQLKEVIQAIENEMKMYDNLSLDLASSTLPYPEELLESAFQWMGQERQYELEDIPKVGLTLTRK